MKKSFFLLHRDGLTDKRKTYLFFTKETGFIKLSVLINDWNF